MKSPEAARLILVLEDLHAADVGDEEEELGTELTVARTVLRADFGWFGKVPLFPLSKWSGVNESEPER